MAREQKLAMTRQEYCEFLENKSVLILATIDANGVAVGDVARYAVVQDALCFRLPKDTPTYENLVRDNRIACCAEQNPTYLEIASVVVHGRAEEVTNAAEAARLAAAIEARGPAIPTARRDQITERAALFRVPIDDVMSFDFSKIDDKSRAVDH